MTEKLESLYAQICKNLERIRKARELPEPVLRARYWEEFRALILETSDAVNGFKAAYLFESVEIDPGSAEQVPAAVEAFCASYEWQNIKEKITRAVLYGNEAALWREIEHFRRRVFGAMQWAGVTEKPAVIFWYGGVTK